MLVNLGSARNLFLDYGTFLVPDYDRDYLFPETRTFLVLDHVWDCFFPDRATG